MLLELKGRAIRRYSHLNNRNPQSDSILSSCVHTSSHKLVESVLVVPSCGSLILWIVSKILLSSPRKIPMLGSFTSRRSTQLWLKLAVLALTLSPTETESAW